MRLYCSTCQVDVDAETVTGVAPACPHCGRGLDPTLGSYQRTSDADQSAATPTADPTTLGRYRITGVLGEGGFGKVYRGVDDELGREVAIKVPRRVGAAADEFLKEARVLAKLDHPHIVPVHDVGRTANGLCFVVSKYIAGGDLKGYLDSQLPSIADAVGLILQAADALHYAHQQGLVHRDIKPGNLLIDAKGQIVVADFGLVLRDEDFGKGGGISGTPAYMSPEQARGEGHRVDARSDVYSLGVVLYELLTGKRPFHGKTIDELLDAVTTQEPKPPRQHNGAVPREVDRIVLKCLSKRAADRYSTAADLAEDLRHWQSDSGSVSLPIKKVSGTFSAAEKVPDTFLIGSDSDKNVVVVPKGLRSFDAGDAGFFLALLPGPHDREGLPANVRSWKTRIEEMDCDKTFNVGLLFGPSGCGKSSLVKAGLLPRLAKQVRVVYLEASADDTEARLLRGLRKSVPELPEESLQESLAGLRRGRWLPSGQKVLLVLDQFEQWLYAKREEDNTPLVQALRQADGSRVQVLVMVRDDFGMAAARFMADLEVPILEGHNFGTVDRFDLRHAKKVLTLFGRAFNSLPEGEPSAEQTKFLDQAINGLAEDGKVISVRLALVAEMLKGKTWVPTTLAEVGGVAGVGVTFLEETLGDRTTNPAHKLHAASARAVLRALLPEQGTDIKGTSRSLEELQTAAGNPRRFDELLRILDSELRLITPVDTTGEAHGWQPVGPVSETQGVPPLGLRGFQLTHDYLVPSLRDWLTRKQRETARGRAELRLAERAALWTAKPEDRFLPSVGEYLTIRRHVPRTAWTTNQAALMRRTGRRLTLRTTGILTALLLALTIGWYGHGTLRAQSLVRSLASAATPEVPALVAELGPYHRWADPALKKTVEQTKNPKERLHARLALLPVDATQAEALVDALLEAAPAEVPVIRDALAPHLATVGDRLWTLALEPPAIGRRLNIAACLPADDSRWARLGPVVAKQLCTENPVHLGVWSEAFAPMKMALIPTLGEVFRGDAVAERSVATSLLTDFAKEQPAVLADLLMDADATQFAALFPLLKTHGEVGLKPLLGELAVTLKPSWPDAPATGTVEPAVIRQIESGHGLVAERTAFVAALPAEQWDAVNAAMTTAGYGVIRLRPSADVVTAAWMRSPLSAGLRRAARLLKRAELDAADVDARKAGLRLADLAGYFTGEGERFAAVWCPADDVKDMRFQAGVTNAQYTERTNELDKEKFAELTFQSYATPTGEVRYCVVYGKPVPGCNTSSGLDTEEVVRKLADDDRLLSDISLHPSREYWRDAAKELGRELAGPAFYVRNWQPLSAHPERQFAACWQANANLDHQAILALPPAEHAAKARELMAAGYRCAAISTAEIPDYETVSRDPTALRRGALAPREASAPLRKAVGSRLTVLLTASSWHRPIIADAAKEKLTKRQANAAVALLRLNQEAAVWPLLKHSPDPRLRSWILAKLSPLGADPQTIINRLDSEPDVSARRALLIALGEFGPAQPALEPKLLALYRDDPDPGIHSAAAWTLRQWGHREKLKAIDAEFAANRKSPIENRKWFVNGQGQTYAIIPGPSEFWMGSPRAEAERYNGDEQERRHRRRIDRTFAIATHEVTVGEFLRFRGNHSYNTKYAPTPDHPMTNVTWYDVAEYCNWLSRQEGIPEDQWAYQPNARGQFAEGMKVKPDALQLTGYRLPSEAEWELMARAGATAARHYGESPELEMLGRHAWYNENSRDRNMLPVGTLRPYDFGAFDALGNAREWIGNGFTLYSEGNPVTDQRIDRSTIMDGYPRGLRGGGFYDRSLDLRSAFRYGNRPDDRDVNNGVRPARTLPF